mmetsp:Transcript_6769/g.14851  ORF Transcript_6769/g.14851 Transcript_6769/m.14851 type:complete len:204 (+) Transcript_6769:1518-2129(+)
MVMQRADLLRTAGSTLDAGTRLCAGATPKRRQGWRGRGPGASGDGRPAPARGWVGGTHTVCALPHLPPRLGSLGTARAAGWATPSAAPAEPGPPRAPLWGSEAPPAPARSPSTAPWWWHSPRALRAFAGPWRTRPAYWIGKAHPLDAGRPSSRQPRPSAATVRPLGALPGGPCAPRRRYSAPGGSLRSSTGRRGTGRRNGWRG